MPPHATAQDVIVADNDYTIRDILRSLLDRFGLNVIPAEDGLEAIDYASRTRARLVILDLKMPKLDGFAACARIRHLPGYLDVPIAILSAFDSAATRQAARNAGATRFLSKPFRPIELLRSVRDLLGETPADGTLRGLAEPPPVFVWKRRTEAAPRHGEPDGLSDAGRLLRICRR